MRIFKMAGSRDNVELKITIDYATGESQYEIVHLNREWTEEEKKVNAAIIADFLNTQTKYGKLALNNQDQGIKQHEGPEAEQPELMPAERTPAPEKKKLVNPNTNPFANPFGPANPVTPQKNKLDVGGHGI